MDVMKWYHVYIASAPWQARFGAVAEWIVRAKSSFQESYYFRELTSHVSPQRISSAVAGIFSSHPSQAAPQPPLSTQVSQAHKV